MMLFLMLAWAGTCLFFMWTFIKWKEYPYAILVFIIGFIFCCIMYKVDSNMKKRTEERNKYISIVIENCDKIEEYTTISNSKIIANRVFMCGEEKVHITTEGVKE